MCLVHSHKLHICLSIYNNTINSRSFSNRGRFVVFVLTVDSLEMSDFKIIQIESLRFYLLIYRYYGGIY